MNEHCKHDECQTPYCPHCGDATKAAPSEMLLRHIETHIGHCDQKLADIAASQQNENTNEWLVGRRIKKIAVIRRTLRKWTEWRKFVIQAIGAGIGTEKDA